MKRLFSALCCICLLFSLLGCTQISPVQTTAETTEATEATEGPYVPLPTETVPEDESGFVVPNPLSYPDFVLHTDQSPSYVRSMAIRAMKLNLSLQWSSAKGVTYNKTGPVSNKLFMHFPDTIYAGLPYSNAGSGIFQFLEFYDEETGRLWFPYSDKNFNLMLGNSCADSVIWGLCAVCDSISGPFYPVTMVPKNGYIPIGSYTFDQAINTYNQLPTYQIVKDNGNNVMLESYAEVLPADLLVSSSPDNHAIMVTAYPVIIRNENGSINPDKSYVTIQDQRGGQGQGFYEHTERGKTVHYSGRTKATFTFSKLLEKGYIPLSTSEFLGNDPYVTATVTTDRECATLEELRGTTVSCNYPLAVVKAVLKDKFGTEMLISRKLFSAAGEEGVARDFCLGELEELSNTKFLDGLCGEYTLYIEVVPSNGERFMPIEFTVKGIPEPIVETADSAAP